MSKNTTDLRVRCHVLIDELDDGALPGILKDLAKVKERYIKFKEIAMHEGGGYQPIHGDLDTTDPPRSGSGTSSKTELGRRLREIREKIERTIKQFDYRVYICKQNEVAGQDLVDWARSMENFLNITSQDGWRCISSLPTVDNSRCLLIFERSITREASN